MESKCTFLADSCSHCTLIVSAAASIALLDQPNLTAEEIVRRSMKIAGDICVYTNHNLVVETINPVSIPATPAVTGAAAATTATTAVASVWSPKDPSSLPVTPVNENLPSSDT